MTIKHLVTVEVKFLAEVELEDEDLLEIVEDVLHTHGEFDAQKASMTSKSKVRVFGPIESPEKN